MLLLPLLGTLRKAGERGQERPAHKSAPVGEKKKKRGGRTKQQGPQNGQMMWGATLPCQGTAQLQHPCRSSSASVARNYQQVPKSPAVPLAACKLQLLECIKSKGFKAEVSTVGHIQYLQSQAIQPG